MKYTLNYKTVIEKDGDYYHGYAPSLPGCHTQGNTIEETKENLKEAMSLWIESCAVSNKPIPKPDVNRVESIETVDLTYLSKKFTLRYA